MKRYAFQAKIEASHGGGHVLFPYNVEEEFGVRGRVPIKATFDGLPYSGSLVKYGAPQHMLPILKAIREQIGKGPGDIVQVEVWKDEEERTVEVPEPLQLALKREGLTKFFNELSYTHRREYCRWITEAKREETRTNRVEKAIGMLRLGVKTPDGAKLAGKNL